MPTFDETDPEVAREIIMNLAFEACYMRCPEDDKSLPAEVENKLVELNAYVCATLGIEVPYAMTAPSRTIEIGPIVGRRCEERRFSLG
jgi:hypothetical protein